LAREPKPKLSIASGWSYNEGSVRTGGQLGGLLNAPLNIHTFISDFIFKYRGFSLYGEYIDRAATTSPVTIMEGEKDRYIYQGTGVLLQSGYLFKKTSKLLPVMPGSAPMRKFNPTKTFAIIMHSVSLNTSKAIG
jgi:hypothetical protein